jgi:hypothetical protein
MSTLRHVGKEWAMISRGVVVLALLAGCAALVGCEAADEGTPPADEGDTAAPAGNAPREQRSAVERRREEAEEVVAALARFVGESAESPEWREAFRGHPPTKDSLKGRLWPGNETREVWYVGNWMLVEAQRERDWWASYLASARPIITVYLQKEDEEYVIVDWQFRGYNTSAAASEIVQTRQELEAMVAALSRFIGQKAKSAEWQHKFRGRPPTEASLRAVPGGGSGLRRIVWRIGEWELSPEPSEEYRATWRGFEGRPFLTVTLRKEGDEYVVADWEVSGSDDPSDKKP